ncbi:MAG TPA: hypothetical protein VNT50_07345 [Microbacterium sp.]|uniref:hypothetical protein n=1 Tax=Microbacterium sp. TaxID=51671 RepID=UPI002C51F433|nr:hypothetical protein [Microbacterium sp.]HWI31289.1 hypothetical protein [Microbacterium sp.]
MTSVVESHPELASAMVTLRTYVMGIVDAEVERAPRCERALHDFAGALVLQLNRRAREMAGRGRAAEVAAAVDLLFGQHP